MFENYTDCLLHDKIILKSQQTLKSDYHNVCTEQFNKIALRGNYDKRLQTFDRTTTYHYGTNAFKVCKSEILSNYKWFILMIMEMKKDNNLDWPYVPDWPYRILIIGGSRSGKTNHFWI